MADEPRDPAALAPLARAAATYPTSRLSPRFELIDLATEIARADETVAMIANAKLDVIRQEIAALQDRARAVLEEAAATAELHRARCNFRKVPGRVYHLYKRDADDRYFSMLSPDEWGGAPPHAFEGSYRVEADLSFTRLGELPR
jgi:alkylation response protein AidB-like acyl-CoA dehydrogenase